MEYLCSITIDVNADSPEAAAKRAWELLSGPDSMLPVVTVATEGGPQDFDLQEIAERNTNPRLLSTAHPVYLRRLVRELKKHSVDGFYYNGQRYNRAQYRYGKIEVRLASDQWWITVHALDSNPISDPYGNEIVASRKP